jgi:hypothetical protein
MKLIVDPGDVYQLVILNFNMQLAKISNCATYAVSYTNFSYITQMTFTGTFYILIFNDLCIHLNSAIHTNIENIVQHILGQQCFCKQQKPKESELLQGCSLLSIQHKQTCNDR